MFIPVVFAATLVGAVSRCNDLVATKLQDQVRGYEARPPADADLATRLSALQDVLNAGNAEADILSHTCPERDYPPLASELNAVEGWAYALQTDVVQRQFTASCSSSANAVSAGFLAAGWLRLARSVPAGDEETPLSKRVEALIRKRATAIGLDLPTFSDTTDYWVKGVQSHGRDAAQACPSPMG